jgi:aldehyde:ferredoxin oxidoreductase
MALGFHGKILRVDLSNRTISTEEQDEKFYRRYFGGSGFTAYYLLKETDPGIDPLDPSNKLIFSAGPLTGVPFPGAGRHSIGAKSPLTNAFGDGQAGGYWATELKKAGFDAIVVDGASESPVYMVVEDGKAEIRDGSGLWGLTGKQCIDEIHRALGTDKASVSYIGPGGENLVRYACIGHDLRAYAGRCGLGAVMGSKRLKAIAVMGSQDIPVADWDRIREINRWFAKERLPGGGPQSLNQYGTAGGLLSLSRSGGLPTRNFREGSFEGANAITGATMNETILVGRERCFACPIACKRVVKAKGSYPVSSEYGGPEYESLGALGSTCGVSDLAVVARANQLCGDYSLDTISTGVVIAFAMECFEEGILTKEDTGGLELTFGNGDAMLELIELIAHRKGLGDLLAEGSMRAAQVIGRGAEEFAMHAKGQEVPMHEPRLKHALGVGYAVSPTGADHCHNIHDTGFTAEQSIADWKALGVLEPVPLRELGPDKIRLLTYVSNWNHFKNSAVVCSFVPWSPVNFVDLVTGVTGWNTSAFELMKLGERVCTMARVYNIREGFGAKDDVVPKRLREGFSSGPLEGVSIDKDVFQQGIKYYYESMGWSEAGIPTTFKLHELSIPWARNYLGD